ncbi:MAG TPA: right-handed parallel beta-helix repeat-containing protein [Fimbriimonadaceae bacterium]|nr:right-handed parallel beta-helix repeat-containing protein [Fimbriimonadaceae bacterium]
MGFLRRSWVSVATFAFGAAIAHSAIHYVDADAVGSNSGSSWANAFSSLYSALATAQPADQIWVASGVYRASAGSFAVPPGVELYGGFAGGEVTVGQRNPSVNLTTLSGDLLGDDSAGFVNRSDNSENVVSITGATPNTVLDGFTIRGGSGVANGNGLRSISGSPLIQNCLFTDNLNTAGFGQNGGAGAFVSGGSARFVGCRFTSNATNMEDGAGLLVDLFASSIELVNCEFVSNVAGRSVPFAASAASGAGLYSRTNTTLTNCLFASNRTFGGGGGAGSGAGAYVDSFTHSIIGCRFEANIATTSAGAFTQGAGLRAAATNLLEITDCEFIDNEIVSADGRGGGLWINSASDGRITGCEIRGNRATAEGAGVWIQGHCNLTETEIVSNGSATTLRGGGLYKLGTTGGEVARCTVSSNRAVRGGGLYVTSGNLSLFQTHLIQNQANEGGGLYANLSSVGLMNSLVATNQASAQGGGLLVIDLATSRPLSLSYSTISSNQSAASANVLTQVTPAVITGSILYFGTSTFAAGSTASRSIIMGGFPGSNSSADPLFRNAAGQDFRLTPGSPAIDFASSAIEPGFDLLGLPRPQDGDLDGASIADAGCFELLPQKIVPYDFAVLEGELFEGDLDALLSSNDTKVAVFNDPDSLAARVRALFNLSGQNINAATSVIETSVARPGLAVEIWLLDAQTNQPTFHQGAVATTIDAQLQKRIPTSYYQGAESTWIEARWFPLNDEDPATDGWLHFIDDVHLLVLQAP